MYNEKSGKNLLRRKLREASGNAKYTLNIILKTNLCRIYREASRNAKCTLNNTVKNNLYRTYGGDSRKPVSDSRNGFDEKSCPYRSKVSQDSNDIWDQNRRPKLAIANRVQDRSMNGSTMVPTGRRTHMQQRTLSYPYSL